MSTVAIVQARMTSTRMPGKVMAPLAGLPSILRQLERIRRAETLDEVVVATSSHSSDDSLVDVLSDSGVLVVRGDLHDVLSRFVTTMERYPSETVVRLTADCPLASAVVIDAVVDEYIRTGADYCSNTMRPTFPDGLDVEVVKSRVLLEVASASTDSHEREHVTLGVYRKPEVYSIVNVLRVPDLSELRWTVDTPEDYEFVAGVFDELYPINPDFDIDDILDYIARHPERSRTAAHAKRNAALDGLETGAMNA